MEFTSFLTPTAGATGILTLVVLLVLWGKLIPRAMLDDIRADKDKQIDTWRAAYEKSQDANEVLRQQVTTLLEANKVSTSVIQALPQVAGMNSERGGHGAAKASAEG